MDYCAPSRSSLVFGAQKFIFATFQSRFQRRGQRPENREKNEMHRKEKHRPVFQALRNM